MTQRILCLPHGGPAPTRPAIAEWQLHVAAYTLLAVSLLALRSNALDFYEHVILAGTWVACLVLARAQTPLSRLLLASLALGGAASALQARWPLQAGSQTLILALVLATWIATLSHLWAWWTRSAATHRLARAATTTATLVGTAGLLARWHESYGIAGAGHIPISNLYEVFVLFIVVCGVIQIELLRDEARRSLAAFIGPVASAAAGFLVWYALARQAQALQPLVPALDSYWMKLHVPANFIGYGAFCAAAMVAAAWLLAANDAVARRLPPRAVIEQLMYRLIAVGFVFFTIATVLGSLWAAEAWGSYWSWDPKETWALIVWLNYGAWLHLRLAKGTRGALPAWWALVGLLVTLFAFLGVNMYLSGLHSYGKL